MKKVLMLFALITYFSIPVLGQYTVKIRIGIIDRTVEGWQIHVSYADVFNDNGELIPHEDLPGGTTYVWEQDQCQLGQGFIPKAYNPTLDCDGEVSEEGEPNPTITCDNSLNFSNYLFRVKVTINSTVFISDTVRFPDNGSGSLDQKIVNFDQRREEDNNSVGMIGKLRGNSFLHYVVPFTYCYPANIQNDIYRASQSLDFNQSTQQYEKYSHWIGFSDVVNHKTFTLNQYTTQLTSQFNKVTGATVKANMLEFPGFPLTVNFKDPWLIDDDTDPLGLRNRGMLANPLPLDNIQNNLGINTNHQGVLLDQDPVQSPAYYSIEIPSSIYLPQTGKTHNVYLQNWDVSGASLEDENSLETGVVFTNSSGASITANVKATQLSDNQNAFINNSQRKFIRTPDLTNTLHMVYESMGHVYYETSIDNGENWILMNSYLLQLTTLDK